MLLLFSCGSDDDSNTINPSDLVGKWSAVKFETYVEGVLVNTEYETQNPECPYYTQFNADYTGVEVDFDIEDCTLLYEDDFTYSIDGNYIESNFGDRLLVESVSNTNLVLSSSEFENGIETTYKGYYEKLD